jgi:hypothetical protein
MMSYIYIYISTVPYACLHSKFTSNSYLQFILCNSNENANSITRQSNADSVKNDKV